MGYSILKAALDAVVKTNGRQEITGANLNGVMTTLLQGVDVLDRSNPADTTGMNKVVLDKSKTFAEQVVVTNTIYEIRDIFDLGNASVTIPSDCILSFKGGKVSNGTLVGNETKVEYSSSIFSGMKFSGTWRIPVIKSSMFEDSTRVNAFQEYISLSKNDNFANRIVFEKGDFYINTTEAGYALVDLSSNTEIQIIGDIHMDAGQESSSIVFRANTKENISIFGSGNIFGDRDTNLNDSEYGWGFFFDSCNNVRISGITISKTHGDGCYFIGVCSNIEVDGCTFYDNRRMGITCSSGTGFRFTNNVFHYVGRDGKNPRTAIEFEDDHHTGNLSEVLIQNNRFSNCYIGVLINQVTSNFFNFVISNNSFIECKYVFTCSQNAPTDVVFENNNIINNTDTLVVGIHSRADNLIIRNNHFDCPSSGIQGAISIIGGRNVIISNNNVRANVCIRVQSPGCTIENNICYSYDSASENYGLIYDYHTNTDVKTIINNNDVTGRLYFVGMHIEMCRNIFRYVSGGYGCTFGISGIHATLCVVKDNQFVAGSFTGWQFYCNCDNCEFDGLISDNPSRVLIITGNNNFVQTIEKAGPTTDRPSYLNSSFRGSEYYDTTLKKKIVWNGTAWVNMDGSALA